MLAVIGILLAITVFSLVYATLMASYMWTTKINVTGAPGLRCDDSNGPITFWDLGDVQQSFSKSKQLSCINTGGGTIYIIPTSLKTTGVPSGVHVTWTVDSAITLGQGQTSSAITLTISADSTATVGPCDITITIEAYDTTIG